MLVICAFWVVPETLLVAPLVAKLCFHGTRPLRHCQLRTHGFRGHDEGPTKRWRPRRNHTDHRPKAIDASARIYIEGVRDTHCTPPSLRVLAYSIKIRNTSSHHVCHPIGRSAREKHEALFVLVLVLRQVFFDATERSSARRSVTLVLASD